MARSVAEIKQQMVDTKNSLPELSGLTSDSKTAIWGLWLFIVAVAISWFEQLMDLFVANVESKIDLIAYGTNQWVQSVIFDFQTGYDIVLQTDQTQDNYLNYYYPTIDPAARIVSRCSVTTLPNRSVSIKVATSEPPTQLTPTQITEINDYIDERGIAGIDYTVTSSLPDYFVFVGAQVSYQGQFISSIQASVEAAIDSYFQNIDFNGIAYLNDIISTVMSVDGVVDFKIDTLQAKNFSGSTTSIVTSFEVIQTAYPPFSGYFYGNDYSGITYTPQ